MIYCRFYCDLEEWTEKCLATTLSILRERFSTMYYNSERESSEDKRWTFHPVKDGIQVGPEPDAKQRVNVHKCKERTAAHLQWNNLYL